MSKQIGRPICHIREPVDRYLGTFGDEGILVLRYDRLPVPVMGWVRIYSPALVEERIRSSRPRGSLEAYLSDKEAELREYV